MLGSRRPLSPEQGGPAGGGRHPRAESRLPFKAMQPLGGGGGLGWAERGVRVKRVPCPSRGRGFCSPLQLTRPPHRTRWRGPHGQRGLPEAFRAVDYTPRCCSPFTGLLCAMTSSRPQARSQAQRSGPHEASRATSLLPGPRVPGSSVPEPCWLWALTRRPHAQGEACVSWAPPRGRAFCVWEQNTAWNWLPTTG